MTDSADGDFTILSLPERLNHKLWKARMHGYQELNGIFQKASVRSAPREVSQYWTNPDLFASYIVDSNVVAQEQAIAALLSLLDYLCQLAETPRSDMMRSCWLPLLAEKGLASSRAATKQKSQECVLILVSLDDSVAPAIELLEPLLKNKLPRLVASCVECMAQIIDSFGLQQIPNIAAFLPVLLEPLPRLSSHADKNVRSQTMNLILQLYKWLGRDVLQELLLEKLKPIQQRDLDKTFQSYEGEIPPSSQARLFQWQKQIALEEANAQEKDKDGDTLMAGAFQENKSQASSNNASRGLSAPQIDPFDLVPSTAVLEKFPNDFQERITSAKWKDRVEVLDEVLNQILVPAKKLEVTNQDYSDFLRALAHVIEKDANVQAVTMAAQCIHQLCTKLKSNFDRTYGSLVLTSLLERSKEKKQSVNEAICEALNDISNCCGTDTCLEETLRFMNHKIPQVRMESTKFLTRLLKIWKPQARNLNDELLIKLVPDISQASLKIVNDTQPAIRDTGFECLAVLMKLVGEREVSDVVDKLDNIKKKKVYEQFATVEVIGGLQQQRPQAPSASIRDKISPASYAPETNRGKASINLNSPLSNNSSPSLRKPLSTLPSKRGPSSPLKTGNRVEPYQNGLPSMKSRLTTRALTTDSAMNSNKAQAFNAEVEELRKQKQKWLKERQEFLTTITEFQNRSSQLNSENSSLQHQLNSSQSSLHERNIELRSKEMQITRLQDRVSILESELEAKTNLASSNYGVRSVSSFEPPSAPLSQAPPGTPPARRIISSSSNGQSSPSVEINRERRSNSRVSSLEGRVRSPSECSDDLPLRVNSLQLRSEAKSAERTTEPSSDRFSSSNNNFLNDESWKRAAEVTSQLKARIERMRAKTRGMGNP
ncbi:LANO_0E16292g1_1 [Lachancea nothofagi CBS 11611]|uniref:LANO_0E16292g1_1 n=1 Tax=Lachancea nothofagi CBS 11611 TaxID=1266666 RepID=A0A1G4K1U5_9SACH|nr:LANO_0E16292g1_1 [Lachancea nothofagi CBS 11611]